MELITAAQKFGALSQATRIEIVRRLATHGTAGSAAGELATAMGLAPSTLSFHLAALEQAGLVQATRRGRQMIYAVRLSGLRALFGFLTETCCNGRPDLCEDLARLLPDDPDASANIVSAFNVLFVCTRNSARSILAEALLEKVAGHRFRGYSAGTEPATAPMPDVLAKLAAMGHDISRLHAKSWTEFAGPNAPRMDFVITLCDLGTGETCPDLGPRPITAAWPFPDPAKFSGSDVERDALLNQLYGTIRRRLEAFTSLPFSTLDRMALKQRLDVLGDSARMM